MKVSYLVASHNRKGELLKTLDACRAQTYAQTEIHVVDDGSSDGTYEAVRDAFPEVIITRNNIAIGSVASRNQMFDRATGDIFIGFDDDSRFIDPGSTARVVERFEQEPDLGLLEFQDIGPEYPQRIEDSSSDRLRGERHVGSFGAGRYAVRSSVLALTGTFAPFFWHAYEEPDLAIRIWDCGYRCLAWYDIIVWHEFSSMNRNERRTHFYHARNELLSSLMRTPVRYIVPLMAWRMVAQLRYSLGRGWWTVELQVWWEALRLARIALRHRCSVKPETIRRCLLLNRRWVSEPKDVWELGR